MRRGGALSPRRAYQKKQENNVILDLLAQTGLNAVCAASYVSLIAVGLVLIFGVMGVINFAHGELYMAGAYTVVLLYTDFQVPFFFAVAAGLIFVGSLGLAMERTLFRPLRDNPLGGLVASIGFLLILQAFAVMGFGVRMEHIPPLTQEGIEFSDRICLPVSRLYVIVAAVVLLTALWVFLKKTRFGRALRAAAQDPEAAALQGISINQTARIAMFIGAGLAGIAGALTAPLVSVNPHMGHSVIVTALIALPHGLSFSQQEILVFLTINILLVSSYRLLTLTGEWPLGHVVIMGVGAYASALYTKELGTWVPASILLGGATSALFAVALSFPLFRMKGFYFLIGSFAAGGIIRLLWKRFRDPFGGAKGIKGIDPMPDFSIGIYDFDFFEPVSFSTYPERLLFSTVKSMALLARTGPGKPRLST
jgi:branched-chain amino acid transport system permease protein